MSEITREQVVDFLSTLTVIDLSDLVSELEEKWGVSAASMAVAGPAAAAEAAAEQTEFNVVLTSFGAQKIKVIKAVRELTGLGLKEAKGTVEAVPSVIKEAVSKEDGEAAIAALEAAGAIAELK